MRKLPLLSLMLKSKLIVQPQSPDFSLLHLTQSSYTAILVDTSAIRATTFGAVVLNVFVACAIDA